MKDKAIGSAIDLRRLTTKFSGDLRLDPGPEKKSLVGKMAKLKICRLLNIIISM